MPLDRRAKRSGAMTAPDLFRVDAFIHTPALSSLEMSVVFWLDLVEDITSKTARKEGGTAWGSAKT